MRDLLKFQELQQVCEQLGWQARIEGMASALSLVIYDENQERVTSGSDATALDNIMAFVRGYQYAQRQDDN